MHYRKLSSAFVRFLDSSGPDGQPHWPHYRPLKKYSIREHWAFAEREYVRLRRVHVGNAGLVTALVRYLIDSPARAIETALPELACLPVEQWLDELTAFTDGSELRRQDYYRSVTWKELPLLYMLRDDGDEESSFCRDEETARRIAYSQCIEIARSLVPCQQRKDEDVMRLALEEQLGHPGAEFERQHAEFWRAVPECVWLTTQRRRLIGGSIVLPLTATAYDQIHSGQCPLASLNPGADLQIPSRNLFISCMTIFPEIPKPKLPGLRSAVQMRKLNQHGAVLIGPESVSDQQVKLLVPMGVKHDEKSVEQLGYTRLRRNLSGSKIPLYELVIPAPEITIADYSSPGSTVATILGTSWRLLRRD